MRESVAALVGVARITKLSARLPRVLVCCSPPLLGSPPSPHLIVLLAMCVRAWSARACQGGWMALRLACSCLYCPNPMPQASYNYWNEPHAAFPAVSPCRWYQQRGIRGEQVEVGKESWKNFCKQAMQAAPEAGPAGRLPDAAGVCGSWTRDLAGVSSEEGSFRSRVPALTLRMPDVLQVCVAVPSTSGARWKLEGIMSTFTHAPLPPFAGSCCRCLFWKAL